MLKCSEGVTADGFDREDSCTRALPGSSTRLVTMKQLRVTVLMGGCSEEREVSLRSGEAVVNALTKAGATVMPVDVHGHDLCLPDNTDVVFIALHGTFGEDGQVQRLLEERGVPYTGSGVEASEIAFDKARAKQAFVTAGIPTPRYEVLDMSQRDLTWLVSLGFPLVIKPARQGSSVGVQIVRQPLQLEKACLEARRYDDRLVAEQFIAGRELTVGVFDGRALPVIEVRPRQEFFTYQAKYTPGETDYLVPAPLEPLETARAQFLGLQAHKCLGCRDYSRVDIMMGGNGDMSVLEVNTIPGFTETSLVPKAASAAGIDFQSLCMRLVEMALARGRVTLQDSAAETTAEVNGSGRRNTST